MSNERVIFSVVSNTNVYLARVSAWNDIKERQRHPTRHPPLYDWTKEKWSCQAAFGRCVTNL